MSEAPTPSRGRRTAALVGVPVALVAGGAAAFFALRGAEEGPSPTPTSPVPTAVISNTPSVETPEFAFRLRDTEAVITSAEAAGDAGEETQQAAEEVTLTLTRLYSLAFLDPENWRAGSYQTMLDFFADGAARDAAAQDEESLTLGEDAGVRFEEVLPSGGKLDVEVLLDTQGQAFTAVAHVQFTAKAEGSDGTTTVVGSRGQYFMRLGSEGTWTIYAYKVKRDEREPGAGSEGSTVTPSAEPTSESEEG